MDGAAGLDISVVVCTRNPRPDYLRRVLEALRQQTLSTNRWELLVVDNASDDPLHARVDLSWHPRGRCVREAACGLTPARVRGIVESRANLLAFIDDDNVAGPDFLEVAVRTVARFPYLGAFGPGLLEPEFEVQPTAMIRPYVRLLAIRATPAPLYSTDAADPRAIPWGAGLIVRRSVAEAWLSLIEKLDITAMLGRSGDRLFSGEDDLFSWAAVSTGMGFGIYPDLRVTHLIAGPRVSERYLLRLAHDHALSHGILRYKLRGLRPTSLTAVRRVRVGLHGLRNGRFSMRMQWAALRGESDAARIVLERRLHPIGATDAASECFTAELQNAKQHS
jgi:glycosyltransferase involved in cell wall biosynthesis